VALFFSKRARLSNTQHDYFDTVYDWARHLASACSCTRPVVIYALALLARIQDKVRRRLGPGNVRIIFLSALMCAHAMCNDFSYNTRAWAGVSEGRFTPHDLVQAQRSFLTLVSWDTALGPVELEGVAELVYDTYLETCGSGVHFYSNFKGLRFACNEV